RCCGPLLLENNSARKQQSIARRAESCPDRNVSPRRAACNSFRRARRGGAIRENQLRALASCRQLRDRNQTRLLSQKKQSAPSVLWPKSASWWFPRAASFRFGIHFPDFRQNCDGDFFISEYRCIHPDVRNVCIKRSSGTKDLRKSFPR